MDTHATLSPPVSTGGLARRITMPSSLIGAALAMALVAACARGLQFTASFPSQTWFAIVCVMFSAGILVMAGTAAFETERRARAYWIWFGLGWALFAIGCSLYAAAVLGLLPGKVGNAIAATQIYGRCAWLIAALTMPHRRPHTPARIASTDVPLLVLLPAFLISYYVLAEQFLGLRPSDAGQVATLTMLALDATLAIVFAVQAMTARTTPWARVFVLASLGSLFLACAMGGTQVDVSPATFDACVAAAFALTAASTLEGLAIARRAMPAEVPIERPSRHSLALIGVATLAIPAFHLIVMLFGAPASPAVGQVRHVVTGICTLLATGLLVLRSAAAEASETRVVSQLDAERANLRAMFDSSPSVIALLDEQLRYVVLNPAAERLVCEPGQAAKDVLGLTPLDTFGPGFAMANLAMQRVLITGEPLHVAAHRFDTALKPALDGTYWDWHAIPARLPDGTTSGLMVVAEDTSERVRLRDELVHTERLSAIGGLVAGVMHELANPLASVCGYAELLSERADLSDPAREDLAGLLRDAERSRAIVKNLLTFARRTDAAPHTTDLNAVAAEVAALRAYELRLNRTQLELDLEPGSLPVFGDMPRLTQVGLNLLLNAEQVLRDRPDARIVLRTSRTSCGRARFEVIDNGPGVDARLMTKIFEPFFTTKPAGEGTGLGLSVSVGILESFRGTLTVGETPGGGATFCMDLPERDLPVSLPPRKRAVPVEPSNRQASSGGRVLVVDDEVSLGRMIGRVVTGLGCEVDVVVRPADALEHLAKFTYRLVISDLKMPGMSGTALRAEALARGISTKFCFVSGIGVAEPDLAAATDHVPILRKPFALAELRQQLQAMLAEPVPIRDEHLQAVRDA